MSKTLITYIGNVHGGYDDAKEYKSFFMGYNENQRGSSNA